MKEILLLANYLLESVYSPRPLKEEAELYLSFFFIRINKIIGKASPVVYESPASLFPIEQAPTALLPALGQGLYNVIKSSFTERGRENLTLLGSLPFAGFLSKPTPWLTRVNAYISAQLILFPKSALLERSII